MKKVIIILSILFAGTSSFAQSPEWLWAKRAGGTGSDGATAVATDAMGNSFIAGNFQSNSFSIGDSTFTNPTGAGGDIFLAKYDVNGNVLWAKRAHEGSGGYFDAVTSLATDASGNVYMSGYFETAIITFDTITLTNTATMAFDNNIFLVKYDANGNLLWAERAGGTSSGSDISAPIALDAEGNIYISAYFSGAPVTFGDTTLTGISGMTITKCNANGKVLWTKNAGNYSVNSIALGATSGDIYMVGSFSTDTLIMGTDTLINAGSGTSDILIAKYDTGANVQWARGVGGPNYDGAVSVAVDASENVFATGYFKSSQITFGTTILTNVGMDYDDIFLVKYNTNGNVLWAKSAGGINNDDPASVVLDTAGNAYLAGNFSSPSIIFGSDTFTITGMFVAKYEAATGSVKWAKAPGAAAATAAAMSAAGNVYVTGNFSQSTMSFDTIALTNTGITNVFLAKLDTGNGTIVRTSVSIVNNTLNVSLFPNPATDNITIEIPQQAKIQIVNMQGQLVKEIDADSNETSVDISALSPGLYFVKITMGSLAIVRKFVKD